MPVMRGHNGLLDITIKRFVEAKAAEGVEITEDDKEALIALLRRDFPGSRLTRVLVGRKYMDILFAEHTASAGEGA